MEQTLTEVKDRLKAKFSDKGYEIRGNDRIIVVSDNELSEAAQKSVMKDCDRFAVVFFTRAEFNARF